MRLRTATSTVLLVSLLEVTIAQAEQVEKTEHNNPFDHIVGDVISNVIRDISNTTIGDAANMLTPSTRKIIGWQKVHVPGKPIKDCLGPNNELNEEVLRCRNGYTKRVPIYSQ